MSSTFEPTPSAILSLGSNPRRNFPHWLQSILQYLVTNNLEADQETDDLDFSLGAGSFTNAVPPDIFEQECERIGRPLPHIQSSRSLPFIAGESVNDRKRRAEFHDAAQSRITTCFELVFQSFPPIISHAVLETRPGTLAQVISLIAADYGTPDVSVVDDIESVMKLPLNPIGSISIDLAGMIRFKNLLPEVCRAAWNDFRLIKEFLNRLNPAERAKVETTMDIQYPHKLTRTWAQFCVICREQVELYRLSHPVTPAATASAAIRTTGPYCFGCDQQHSGKDCPIVLRIVAAHPEYAGVLHAKRPTPMKIKFTEHTVLVAKGFALVFQSRPTGTNDRPAQQAPGRGRGRDQRPGRGRGRHASASAATDDTYANLDTIDDDESSAIDI